MQVIWTGNACYYYPQRSLHRHEDRHPPHADPAAAVSGKGYYLWRTLPDAGAGGQKGGLCRETAADAGYHKEKAWDYSVRGSGQESEQL